MLHGGGRPRHGDVDDALGGDREAAMKQRDGIELLRRMKLDARVLQSMNHRQNCMGRKWRLRGSLLATKMGGGGMELIL
jgi:hypothetical protein